MVTSHLTPGLGHIGLARLTPLQVQSFLNANSASGLAPRTVGYIGLDGEGWVAVQTGDGFGRMRDGRFAYYEHGSDIGCIVELVEAPTKRDTPELIYPEPAPVRS